MDRAQIAHLAGLGVGLTILCGPTCDGVSHGHSLDSAGKVPMRPAWQRAGYRTAAQLAAEHRNGCNLGVLCGVVPGAPVSVVVVDGDDADALAWMWQHLPPTPWRVATRHGEHWYYRAPVEPTGNRNLRKSHGLALDVRAAGGQVVAPGSTHRTGHVYEVIGGPWTPEGAAALPVYAPAWLPAPGPLYSAAAAPAGPNKATGGAGGAAAWAAPTGGTWPGPRTFSRADYAEAFERALSYAERLPPSVSGSDGHGAAYRAAVAVLRGFPLASLERLQTLPVEGAPVDAADAMGEALQLLSRVYNPRCRAADGETPYPWSEAELRHKVEDAARADRLPGPDFWLFDDENQRERYARRSGRPRPAAPKTAPTLAHLAAVGLGLTPRPAQGGGYLIRCPWSRDHEATITAGPRGDVFTCAVCEGRSVADLLRVARDPQRRARLGLSWTGADLPTRAELKKEAAPEGGASGAAIDNGTTTKRVAMDSTNVNGSDQNDTGSDGGSDGGADYSDILAQAEAMGSAMRGGAGAAPKAGPAPKAAPDDSGDFPYLSNEGADALIVGKTGAVRPVPANVVTILRYDRRWAGVLAFNEFSQKVEKLQALPSHAIDAQRGPGTWEDADTRNVRNWLIRTYKFDASEANVIAGVMEAAAANTYHPIRAYLDGLRWDGVPRLASWLARYLGAEATEYAALAGTYWMVSAVARVMSPGCQADYTLILEGAQGKGKSSALRILGGAFYRSTKIDIHKAPDCYQALRNVWIYEVAELASFKKADGDDLKAYLTCTADTYRDSYGRTVREYPRQVVFGGSVNPDQARDCTYLADATGGRRFWPVRCFVGRERADLAALTIDRDQLWAEAAHLFATGQRWYPLGEEETALFAPQQAARSTEAQADPWDTTIALWLVKTRANSYRFGDDGAPVLNNEGRPVTRIMPLTATAILEGALSIPVERRTHAYQQRVGQAMKRMGWASADKLKSVGGVKCRPYQRLHTDDEAKDLWQGLLQAADAADESIRYRAFAILFTRAFGPESVEELRALGVAAEE